jgi:hypothetical protein
MSAPPRRIEVAIDELVLHGFDRSQRDGIAAAVRAELAAALEGWGLAAGISADRLEAGSFTLPAAAPPAAVGRGVARQIRQVLDTGMGGAGQVAARQAGTAEGGS